MYGSEGWWPAKTPFEVCVGAILTQNTNWSNVVKAIDRLRDARALNARSLAAMDAETLEQLIRPAGFYRQKAERLKIFAVFTIEVLGGDISRLASMPLDRARTLLLSLKGIGEETADSILLYACGMPAFIVDAYTTRWLTRMGMDMEPAEIREAFSSILHRDADACARLHGAIVEFSKQVCRSKPNCQLCTFKRTCAYYLREGSKRSRKQAQR